MAKKEEKKEVTTVLWPEGRLINASLFEKDKFDEKSTASYKIEVAFKKEDLEVDGGLLAQVDEYIASEFGDEAKMDIDGGDVVTPFLDGDKLAKKREAKGKKGDAYVGMWVVRANTIYNKYGQDAPGGIQVWDEKVEEIGPANQDKIYPGCYVQVAATLATYENNDGDNAVKFYLSGVQKTADGEKLAQGKDTSVLFKPRDGGAAANTGRRSRKG